MEALGKIAAQEEEIIRLKARISHLESRLKIEVRNAREAPFEENTPPSKLNFKKDSDEAARSRQGGAKPGHEGHGRRCVAPEDADETREAPAPSVCPDCATTTTTTTWSAWVPTPPSLPAALSTTPSK